MDELQKLLETVTDESQRAALADAIKKDRAGLEEKAAQLLDETKAAKAARKALEDERANELAKREADELARLTASGDTTELAKRQEEKRAAERKAELEQFESLKSKHAETEKRLALLMVDGNTVAAATKVGVTGAGELETIKLLAKAVWRLEDGEAVPRDANGEIMTGASGVLTHDEWITKLRETHSFLFPQPKGAGATGSTSTGSVKVNPWKADQRNRTEQGRILKQDPSLAERLQREAGVV